MKYAADPTPNLNLKLFAYDNLFDYYKLDDGYRGHIPKQYMTMSRAQVQARVKELMPTWKGTMSTRWFSSLLVEKLLFSFT